MFGILFVLTIPFFGDPDEARSVGAELLPVPKLATPSPNHAVEETAVTEARRIRSLLQQWEAASKQQDERSSSAVQNLRLNVTRELNGHAALAVEHLSGQVRAEKLEDQFSWSLSDENADLVCLEAKPKDETELLFYGSIRVWLETKTGRAIKLQATDRAGKARTAWLPDPKLKDPDVVRVAYVAPDGPADAIPPSPATLNQQGFVAVVASEVQAALLYPEVDSKDLSPVTPELAEILDKWEAATRNMKTARIRFTRSTYNPVFELERIADGELLYQAPDNARVIFRTHKVDRAERSARRGKSGNPYRIESDRAETWISTAREVWAVNDEEKSYERALKPETAPDVPWWYLLALPVCDTFQSIFLLDIHAEQIRQEWKLELVRNKNSGIYLIAIPRTARLKAQFERCMVLIDNQTWRTKAVKIFTADQNLEVVYNLEQREVNVKLPDDSFNPDLKVRGYRENLRPSE